MLKTTTILTGALLAMSVTTSALADTAWEKTHPRRDQVNDRIATQNHRIRRQVQAGDLTRNQAAELHRQVQNVRREERLMARQNGGHITLAEQAALNQQQSRISRRIGN